MIIGFAGKKGSGKDTLGNYLIEKYKFERYAFGDPVKEVCRILFGFNDQQLYGDKKEEMDISLGIKPREAFQKIGTNFGRKIFHELFPGILIPEGQIWINIFKNNCNHRNVVLTDVRFQNEADAIKELGGFIIYIDSKYCLDDNHESEQINVEYDFLVKNHGTKDELFQNFDNIFSLII